MHIDPDNVKVAYDMQETSQKIASQYKNGSVARLYKPVQSLPNVKISDFYLRIARF